MPAVVAAVGQATEKIVNGRVITVIPIMGADGEGYLAQLGVGFVCEGQCSIWGLLMPHNLIQSWRAMKLVEAVPELRPETLCDAYYAAQENPFGDEKKRVDRFASLFPSLEEFEAVRKTVLEAVPTPEEVESMLETLRQHDVSVDGYCLVDLIESGRLPMSPLIEEILKEGLPVPQLRDTVGSLQRHNNHSKQRGFIASILRPLSWWRK